MHLIVVQYLFEYLKGDIVLAADCCLLGNMDKSNTKTNKLSGSYNLKDYIFQCENMYLLAYIQTYLSQKGIQTINLIQYDKSSLYRLVSKGVRVIVIFGKYNGDVKDHNILKFIRKYNPQIKIIFCNNLGLGIQELSAMNIKDNFDHSIKTPYFLPTLAESILSILESKPISKELDNETDIAVPTEQDFIKRHSVGEINWYPFKTKLAEISLLKPHIYSNYIFKASDFCDFIIKNTLNILYFGNTTTILYKNIFLNGKSNIYNIFPQIYKLKRDFGWMSLISIHDIAEIDAEMLAFWKCRALFIQINEDDLDLLESIKSSIFFPQKASIKIYVILDFKANEKTRDLLGSVSANIV